MWPFGLRTSLAGFALALAITGGAQPRTDFARLVSQSTKHLSGTGLTSGSNNANIRIMHCFCFSLVEEGHGADVGGYSRLMGTNQRLWELG